MGRQAILLSFLAFSAVRMSYALLSIYDYILS